MKEVGKEGKLAAAQEKLKEADKSFVDKPQGGIDSFWDKPKEANESCRDKPGGSREDAMEAFSAATNISQPDTA